jgi:hypothetical protein
VTAVISQWRSSFAKPPHTTTSTTSTITTTTGVAVGNGNVTCWELQLQQHWALGNGGGARDAPRVWVASPLRFSQASGRKCRAYEHVGLSEYAWLRFRPTRCVDKYMCDAFGIFGGSLPKKIGIFHSSSLKVVSISPNAS